MQGSRRKSRHRAGSGRKGTSGVSAHAPQEKIWGYCEGYYGRLLRWDERVGLIDHLAAVGANAYLYAPKEDSLHRRDWRIRYPAEWRTRFKETAARASRAGVDLVPGMAPGLSYDYLAADDYRVLLSKLRDFQKLGCRTLALLMDDIPNSLPPNCREAFASLGAAHGILLRRLLRDLRVTGACRLWFCPTVYTDQFASGPVERDAYLNDLAAHMPQEVALMWTGRRIIADRLDEKTLAPVSKLFGGRVLLWDNWYANDYCPNKIFLGPYGDRSQSLWRLARGVLLNPTGMPATDRFLLDLVAAFSRGKPAVSGWNEVAAAHGLPKEFKTVAPFLASPYFRPAAKDLTPRRRAALRKALKVLIWDWKGPLHVEWYPHLFMLDADLKAMETGKDKPDEAWVRKRYPPLLAERLLKAGK